MLVQKFPELKSKATNKTEFYFIVLNSNCRSNLIEYQDERFLLQGNYSLSFLK